MANFLHELAAEFKLRGRARFFDQYPASSVMVGLGILGYLEEKQKPTENHTYRFQQHDANGHILSDSLADRVWFVVKKPENRQEMRIVVGRTSESDLTIPELSISTEHCAFEASPFGLNLTDLGSTNGTLVDGRMLRKGDSAALKSGSKIILGRFEFEFLRHKDFISRLQYTRISIQR